MAKVYPPQVDEAIWAMLCDGYKHRSIREALAAGGESPSGEKFAPCQMPERTYFDHVAKLINDRGQPVRQVKEGTELDVIASLRRELLETAMIESKRLRKLASENGLGPREAQALKVLGQHVDEAEVRINRAPKKEPVSRDNTGKPRRPGPDFLTNLRRRSAHAEQEKQHQSQEPVHDGEPTDVEPVPPLPHL